MKCYFHLVTFDTAQIFEQALIHFLDPQYQTRGRRYASRQQILSIIIE